MRLAPRHRRAVALAVLVVLGLLVAVALGRGDGVARAQAPARPPAGPGTAPGGGSGGAAAPSGPEAQNDAVATTTDAAPAPTVATTAADPAPAAESARPPAQQRLDQGWSRAADPRNDGVHVGRPLGRGGGWQPVSVPDVADTRTTSANHRGQVWWYGRQIALPEASPAGTWALRFEGVRRTATVYVNGQEVGRSRDPYAPFEVELPDELAGQVVALAVRIDGRRPPRTSEGWWNWQGIVRPVVLVPRGRLTTSDPAVQGDARCTGVEECETSVRVRAEVRNRTAEAVTGRARIRVTDPDGEEVAAAERDLGTLAPGETRGLSADLPVPDGRLWTPSDPALHRASVELLSASDGAAGRVEQQITRDVGLRGVTVAGGRMLLNGRALRLRGASIHEDLPGRGAALSDADVDRYVTDLREAGANVTRAHYSLDARLLSALDRAGIMVWAQAPVYHADGKLTTRAGREIARGANRRSVIATRNHPSVITHSVANELSPEADRRRGTRAYLAGARADAQALDPTVPPAIDLLSYPGYRGQRAYRAFPVIGLNTYFGWYDGRRPPHSTRRLRDLRPFLAWARRAYPSSSLSITEMGAEGVRSGPRSRKGTLGFQARYLRQTMDVVDDREDLTGAIYWTLREFAVKPRWKGGPADAITRRDGIHRKGLLTYAGARKPVWTVARQRLDGAVWGEGVDPDEPVERVAGGMTADGAVATLLVVLLLGWLGRVMWWDALHAGGRERRVRRPGRTGGGARPSAPGPDGP